MSELLTSAEADARWPIDIYPIDSLGGMRRDIIHRFWSIAGDMDPEVRGVFAEVFAQKEERIDELMDAGLRQAFKALMGYNLPTITEADDDQA